MNGAKTAPRIRKITTTPPARAILSRLSRIHAIRQRERPSIAFDTGGKCAAVSKVYTGPLPP